MCVILSGCSRTNFLHWMCRMAMDFFLSLSYFHSYFIFIFVAVFCNVAREMRLFDYTKALISKACEFFTFFLSANWTFGNLNFVFYSIQIRNDWLLVDIKDTHRTSFAFAFCTNTNHLLKDDHRSWTEYRLMRTRCLRFIF